MVYAPPVLFAILGLLAATSTTLAHPGEQGQVQHRHRRGQDYASDIPPFNPSEALNYASQTNAEYYLSTTSLLPLSPTSTPEPTKEPESTTPYTWASQSNQRSDLFASSNSTSIATSAPPSSSAPPASSTVDTPPSSTTESVLQVSGTAGAVARGLEYGVVFGGVVIAGLGMV